jgi:hypothetical protein
MVSLSHAKEQNQVVTLGRSRSISYATGKGRIRPTVTTSEEEHHIKAYAPLHSTISSDSIATRNSIQSPVSDLFEGTNADVIPGNLHVSSNSSIEHLIKRYGAVTLIRQLSTDLAQREAEMLLNQRKASQREKVMMKLLNEMGFSSSQVESMIREKANTDTRDDQQYLRDLINDAMEEKLDHDESKESSIVTPMRSKVSEVSTTPSSSEDINATLTPKKKTRPHSLSSPPVPTSNPNTAEGHYDIFQGNILNVVSHKFLNHVPQPVHDVIINSNTNNNKLVPVEMENFNSAMPPVQDKEGYVDQFGFIYDNRKSNVPKHSSSYTHLNDSTAPLRYKLRLLAQDYDKSQQQGFYQWDEFIKKIALLDNDNHGDLLVINGENISHYKHLYNDLTRLVQTGIPTSLRPKLWTEMCGAKTLRNPTEYYTLLNNTEANIEAESQIELDLYRTMPFNVFFKDNGPGLSKLQNVLIGFSRRYPQIGYCQGMNFIVANLLLVYHNDEDVFWAFVGLYENVLPKGFFNLSNIKRDMVILKHNFREQLPKLHEHFHQCDVELDPICFNWFMSLFTDGLSVHIVFRIWDQLMLKGYMEIHKTSIALFKIFEEKLMTLESNIEIYEFMKNLNKINFNLRGTDLIRISSSMKINQGSTMR